MSRVSPPAIRCAFASSTCAGTRYIRGKRGVVERICGAFRNPEQLAYGRWDGPTLPLYRVRFAQRDVWPDYGGAEGDSVDVELYEHWLEPAEERR